VYIEFYIENYATLNRPGEEYTFGIIPFVFLKKRTKFSVANKKTGNMSTKQTISDTLLNFSPLDKSRPFFYLKGQCHEIFDVWFFSPIDYP
jgi:hypothetical protein